MKFGINSDNIDYVIAWACLIVSVYYLAKEYINNRNKFK